MSRKIEMKIRGLSTDSATCKQVLWLMECRYGATLPIIVDSVEAATIRGILSGHKAPMPTVHDLFKAALDHLGAWVEEVQIVDFQDEVFCAKLVLGCSGQTLELTARSTDAIVLALKYGAPIYLVEEALEKAGCQRERWARGGRIDAASACRRRAPAWTREEVAAAIESLLEEVGIASGAEVETPESRLEMLARQMSLAVKSECYEEAARLREEIERIEREEEGKM